MRTHKKAVNLVRQTAKAKLPEYKTRKLANISVVELMEQDIASVLSEKGLPDNILKGRAIREIIEDEMVALEWSPKAPQSYTYFSRGMKITLLIFLGVLWVLTGFFRTEIYIVTAIGMTFVLSFVIYIMHLHDKAFKRLCLFPIPA